MKGLEVYSDALIKLSVFPIYKPLPRGPGSSTSLARCLQEQKVLLQGEDLEQEMDTDEPVKKRGGCGDQQPNITVDGMKMVAEVKTTKTKTDEQGEMFPTLLLHVHMCKTSIDGDKKSIGPPSYKESYRGRPAGPPDRLPPRNSPDGGSPVDICLGLCLVRS